MEQDEGLGFLLSVTYNITSRAWTDAGAGGQQSLRINVRAISTARLDSSLDSTWTTLRDGSVGKVLSLLTTFSTANLIGTLRLREYTCTVVPNTNETVFDIAGIWNSEYRWANISGGTPQMHLPPQVEFTAGERMTTVYRNQTWTTGTSANLNTTVDIGGTKVDQAGKGVPVRVATMDVKISMLIDTSQGTTTGTLVSLYDDMSTVQGTWNSVKFLHWSAGEVYCLSADVNHVRDEYYRTTYVFRWDRWSDCEQICETDGDGYPYLVGGQAKTVFWKSLVRSTTNFNLIFDTQADPALVKQICLEGSWLTYP